MAVAGFRLAPQLQSNPALLANRHDTGVTSGGKQALTSCPFPLSIHARPLASRWEARTDCRPAACQVHGRSKSALRMKWQKCRDNNLVQGFPPDQSRHNPHWAPCRINRLRAASETTSTSMSTENGRPATTASLQAPSESYFPNNEANIKVIGKFYGLHGMRIALEIDARVPPWRNSSPGPSVVLGFSMSFL
jgi:hypothetical protein